MGWLLGDIGSAVWLGRRTLEAVAADLDGRGPRTRLTEEIGAVLDLDLREGRLPPSPTGDPRQDLIRALDEQLPAGAPAALGRFAPLPGSIPGDPVAREILDIAIAHVGETVHALDPEAELPVVLAGSVLTGAGPIHDEVTQSLRAGGRSVSLARTGLPGALLLAREAAAELLPGTLRRRRPLRHRARGGPGASLRRAARTLRRRRIGHPCREAATRPARDD